MRLGTSHSPKKGILERSAPEGSDSVTLAPWLFQLLAVGLAILTGAFALRVMAAPAHASVTFAAVGDVPYNAKQKQILRDDIARIGQDSSIEFFVHLGDITCGKGCPDQCEEDLFKVVSSILRASKKPVFIIPGDNEWNDCVKGGGTIEEVHRAWRFWTKHFLRFEERWAPQFQVKRQPGRRENFTFVHKGVIFIGLNMVGGVPNIPSKAEWDERIVDALEWTTQNLRTLRPGVHSAVIFGHAQPDPRTNRPFEEHKVFFSGLERAAREFAKPILYLHGDGHKFEKQTGFLGVENLYRVEVDGDHNYRRHLKIVVTGDPENPFILDRGP